MCFRLLTASWGLVLWKTFVWSSGCSELDVGPPSAETTPQGVENTKL